MATFHRKEALVVKAHQPGQCDRIIAGSHTAISAGQWVIEYPCGHERVLSDETFKAEFAPVAEVSK